MADDRRRAPRVELLGQIHGQVVPYDVTVTVRNVSLGGLSLETPFPFPLGVAHDFRLRLGDDSAVLLRGTILRCEAQRAHDGSTVYLTGVQFLDDPADDDESGIGTLLDRLG
jgi:hypothetical protein